MVILRPLQTTSSCSLAYANCGSVFRWSQMRGSSAQRVRLDFLAAAAENRAPCGEIGGLMNVREYLVLKHDGSTLRFPVRGGDVDQARLRAALTQRPEDDVVAVTDDAYIRVGQRSSTTAALRQAKGGR